MKKSVLFILLLFFSVSLSAADRDELYRRAKEAFENKKFEEAIPLLKQLENKGDDPEGKYKIARIYYMLIVSYLETGDLKNSEIFINRGMTLSPRDPELIKARDAFLQKAEEAELALPPDELFDKAKIVFQGEDYTAAIPLLKVLYEKEYDQTVRYKESDVCHMLAVSYIYTEDNENSVLILEEGMNKFPGNIDMISDYCILLLSEEQPEEAMLFLEEQISMYPQHTDKLLHLKARIHIIQGDFEEGELLYEQLLKADDTNRDICLDLGYFNLEKGVQVFSELNDIEESKHSEEYNSLREKSISYLSKAAAHLRKAYDLSTDEERCRLHILYFLQDACSSLIRLGISESEVLQDYATGIDTSNYYCD